MPNHVVGTAEENLFGNILVVDDQSTQRTKIERAVCTLGHQVEAVDSAVSAMAYLQDKPVDLILLDIVMPNIDGIEMLRWLASEPSLQHIPVVVISAYDDESDVVAKAIELGAEDFLPKHFALPILEAVSIRVC